MSLLSFFVPSIEHNEFPLVAIAKFFYGQRVGIVSRIDVVEYYEVNVCGVYKNEYYRRLYVHFSETLERSDTFKQIIMNGNRNNYRKITDNDACVDNGKIQLSINYNTKQNYNLKDTTYYEFKINYDMWECPFPNSEMWIIKEYIGEDGISYRNLYDDKYGFYTYIENISYPVIEEEERRVDLWNPCYNYLNKYSTIHGAVSYTKDEFKKFYGDNWQHFWENSYIWEPYSVILRNCMNLKISVTLGKFFSPHICAINNLSHSIVLKLQEIEQMYYETHDDKREIIWYCGLHKENVTSAYLIINMDIDFMNITDVEFYTIKNTLLEIEHMCEVLKPIDEYNSIPESRIYINFE